MSQRVTGWLALGLLVLMATLMLLSVKNDSLTTDEKPHLAAGVSYVTELDDRLNPEHPPLLKLLAGLVVNQTLHPTVPIDSPGWQQEVNGQWDFGDSFFGRLGSQRDRALFLGRLPFIILSLIFAGALFLWSRRQWGNRAGLLTLALYTLSPTIIAHSRYITMDIGAALGFFVALTAFIEFVERPGWRTAVLAGLGLGLALLIKFSALLLIPIFIIGLSAWLALDQKPLRGARLWLTLLAGTTALTAIGLVYALVISHYPITRNLSDAGEILAHLGRLPGGPIILKAIANPLTRPFGQFWLGAMMAWARSLYGNSYYFLGGLYRTGQSSYFPLLYLTKEPLPIIILAIMSLVTVIRQSITSPIARSQFKPWLRAHMTELMISLTILLYGLTAIRSGLNIGIRHIMPILPLSYLLIGRVISDWLGQTDRPLLRQTVVIGLGIWLLVETVAVFPHYLSYYNELAGGWRHGYQIATDSNYDWGQDLKRLADYAQGQGLDQLAIDYSGSAQPEWYLGDRAVRWWSAKGPAHGWLAVSLNTLESAWAQPAAGVEIPSQDNYSWLRAYEPVTQIGSIMVYNLP